MRIFIIPHPMRCQLAMIMPPIQFNLNGTLLLISADNSLLQYIASASLLIVLYIGILMDICIYVTNWLISHPLRLCRGCDSTSTGKGPLNCDEYTTVWIRKDFNTLTVGTGYIPGVNEVLYYYHTVPYRPRFVSVSSAAQAKWKINKISDVCTVTPEPTTVPNEPTTPICPGKI